MVELEVRLVGGQVVVEPWQRHGSGCPAQPTPIAKQLSPPGHHPPHTPSTSPQGRSGMVVVDVVVVVVDSHSVSPNPGLVTVSWIVAIPLSIRHSTTGRSPTTVQSPFASARAHAAANFRLAFAKHLGSTAPRRIPAALHRRSAGSFSPPPSA